MLRSCTASGMNIGHRIVSILSLLTLAAASAAHGQTYPSKVVRIIVPYSAGGPVDTFGRALAQRLQETWGQPVIIDNKPGANEIIGATEVAKAAPDGYTFILATDPTLSQNPFLFAKLPYATKDLAPVTRLINVNMALVVPASLPVSNAKEFVAYAKAQKDPLNYGSSGNGNTTHIAMEWFKNIAGFPMTHVPYKGAAPALQDMMGGNIQASFVAASVAEPHIKAGKLKAVAISGKSRSTALPNVPTFAEAGFPDYEATFYIALIAPAGTPSPILEKVAAETKKILFMPEFRAKYMDTFGFEPVGEGPAEFAAFIKKDQELTKKKIQVSNVKLEM
jgi:tripartite-type tricarboxylate transporter receptor subunit TctC